MNIRPNLRTWLRLAAVMAFIGTMTMSCGDRKNAPVLRLIGPDTLYALQGEEFEDPGVIAFDKEDLDMTDQVVIAQPVSINTLGYQKVIYQATDRNGNVGEISRIVQVIPSSSSLEGDYISRSNGFTCVASGMTSHLSPYQGNPRQLLISPILGSGTSQLILEWQEDHWGYVSADAAFCGNFFYDAVSSPSSTSDSLVIVVYAGYSFSSLMYVRQ